MESFENQNLDTSKSRQFSRSLAHAMSTEVQDQPFNKNIEDLNKIANSADNFDEVYCIFKRIAIENDFDAMNFAVREKFYDVKNKKNETIFNHSVMKCNYQLAHLIIEFGGNYNDEDMKILLSVPGIDVNAKDNKNNTALIWASLYGCHEVVKLLLTVPGIDINAKTYYFKKTALMKASYYGHHEVVKLLLTVPGIDVNAKDIDNKTALIWASYYGHHEVVKLLLTVPGIDVNAKDIFNKTALIFASCNGHIEVVKLLLTVPGIDFQFGK